MTIGSYIIIVAGYRRIYNGFTVHYMVNIIIYSVIIQSMAQKLSPTARRAKAARDLAYAMTPDRRRKKADSQKRRRAAPNKSKGKDWDHKDGRWESPSQNRGNDGEGTKKESGKNYKI